MTDSELAAILLLLIMSSLALVSGMLLIVLLAQRKRPRLALSAPQAARGRQGGPNVVYRSITPSALVSQRRAPSQMAPLRHGRWPAAQLMVSHGPLRGNRIPVARPILAVGRSGGCDITLPDPETSRQHARLEWRSDGLYLVDTDSTNGTYVNRTRIGQHRLRGGEQVSIGNTVFTIQLY
ncbi:FHA domain-containing protein [Chloroflexota bacterium]